MEIVVWGVGERGKRFFEFMKNDIIAFIDKDIKKDGFYKGIPIISFETYKKFYNKKIIIVSPKKSDEIISLLESNNIYHYFKLGDCPPELYMHRTIDIFENFPLSFDNRKFNAIYGINLFSVLLYKHFKKNNCNKIVLIPEKGTRRCFLKAIKKIIKDLNINYLENVEDFIDNMFVTVESNYNFSSKKRYDVENAFDFSNKINNYYNEKIEKFKNIHAGRRCFIVATGPSLSFEDLDFLFENNEYSISMNHIFLAFNNTKWRPSYYVCQDKKVLKDYEKEIFKVKRQIKFISDYYRNSYEDENTYIYHGHFQDYFPNMPNFSEDISRKIYDGYTVTYTCIQIAVYMGFKEIILLGVDFNYVLEKSSAYNHFYKDYNKEKEKFNNVDEKEIYLAYKKAAEYARKNDIKIYNATRGGKLELFKRKNFDELFQ